MRRLALRLSLPLLFLCCAVSVKADPISIVVTGGTAGTPLGLGNFRANLTGAGFNFDAANFFGPKPQPCGLCSPGQNFPTTIPVSVPDVIQLTYNGISYRPGSFITSNGFVITLPPLTIPLGSDISIVTSPFSFSGTVFLDKLDGSPPIIFSLTGSGIATLTFFPEGNDPGFSRLSAHFAFMPAATTSEPATLLLLGTGLAGIADAVRRRKRRS